MKFLLDMNLSPKWCAVLEAEGWNTVHWSEVGSGAAPDAEIMARALEDERIVITHDLDFGAMLAATQARGPSVVQIRTQDVRPQTLARLLIDQLRNYETELETGSLLVVHEARSRIRLLPLPRKPK